MLDNDLYQLISWKERVARYLIFFQMGREPVYLADHIDYQWGGYRRIEVTEAARIYLKNIITTCNEVIDFNLKIDLLRAEISKRQSRRDVFEKTQYEKKVWFEYQGFSNIHNIPSRIKGNL